MENDFWLSLFAAFLHDVWLGVHDGVQVSKVAWSEEIYLFVETEMFLMKMVNFKAKLNDILYGGLITEEHSF